jgi:ABC-type multidrug transport system fused ATPase/permease subunit
VWLQEGVEAFELGQLSGSLKTVWAAIVGSIDSEDGHPLAHKLNSTLKMRVLPVRSIIKIVMIMIMMIIIIKIMIIMMMMMMIIIIIMVIIIIIIIPRWCRRPLWAGSTVRTATPWRTSSTARSRCALLCRRA